MQWLLKKLSNKMCSFKVYISMHIKHIVNLKKYVEVYRNKYNSKYINYILTNIKY